MRSLSRKCWPISFVVKTSLYSTGISFQIEIQIRLLSTYAYVICKIKDKKYVFNLSVQEEIWTIKYSCKFQLELFYRMKMYGTTSSRWKYGSYRVVSNFWVNDDGVSAGAQIR